MRERVSRTGDGGARCAEQRGIRPQWWVFPTTSLTDYWASHIPDYLRFYDQTFRQQPG